MGVSTAMTAPPALVGIDWGTTSLRAALMAADGAVLEQRESPDGVARIVEAGFGEALRRVTGDWPIALPRIASGMIGSRNGWSEAPYCACPADLSALAGALHRFDHDDGRLHIVPGLVSRADGVPDVMRGEETQVIGALGSHSDGLFVLPGTHSKWVRCEQGSIRAFRTMMTGDAYAALRHHTALRFLMTDEHTDEAAFLDGVKRGAADAGRGLLGKLFSARTFGLFDILPAAALADYLSGLLIGTEIAEADAVAGTITIIGNDSLAARYMLAMRAVGYRAEIGPADAAWRGLHLIAGAAGLIR